MLAKIIYLVHFTADRFACRCSKPNCSSTGFASGSRFGPVAFSTKSEHVEKLCNHSNRLENTGLNIALVLVRLPTLICSKKQRKH